MQTLILRWAVILVAFLLLVGYAFWQRGSKEAAYSALDTAQAETGRLRADLGATQEALDTERQYAQKIQAIATKYEGDKNAIERQAAADLADLRAGNLRLQERWRSCSASLPGAATGPSEPDDGADDRATSAIRAVRAAAECDAQVRGLQEVVKADREMTNAKP